MGLSDFLATQFVGVRSGGGDGPGLPARRQPHALLPHAIRGRLRHR